MLVLRQFEGNVRLLGAPSFSGAVPEFLEASPTRKLVFDPPRRDNAEGWLSGRKRRF